MTNLPSRAPYAQALLMIAAFFATVETTGGQPPGDELLNDLFLPAPKPLAEVRSQLAKKNVNERRQGAEWMLQLCVTTPPKLSDVAKYLDDSDPEVRHKIVCAVNIINTRTGAQEATPQLTRLLTDSKVETRRMAAHILTTLGPLAKEATPSLEKAIQDRDPVVRIRAASVLTQLGVGGRTPLQLMADSLGDPDDRTSNDAIYYLGMLGERAASTVAQCLRHKDKNTRLGALGSVWYLSNQYRNSRTPLPMDIVQGVLDAIGDSDDDIVRQALSDVRALGDAGASALPAIEMCLGSKNEHVRSEAARALKYVGPTAKRAIPLLRQALSSDPDNTAIRTRLRELEK